MYCTIIILNCLNDFHFIVRLLWFSKTMNDVLYVIIVVGVVVLAIVIAAIVFAVVIRRRAAARDAEYKKREDAAYSDEERRRLYDSGPVVLPGSASDATELDIRRQRNKEARQQQTADRLAAGVAAWSPETQAAVAQQQYNEERGKYTQLQQGMLDFDEVRRMEQRGELAPGKADQYERDVRNQMNALVTRTREQSGQ